MSALYWFNYNLQVHSEKTTMCGLIFLIKPVALMVQKTVNYYITGAKHVLFY